MAGVPPPSHPPTRGKGPQSRTPQAQGCRCSRRSYGGVSPGQGSGSLREQILSLTGTALGAGGGAAARETLRSISGTLVTLSP